MPRLVGRIGLGPRFVSRIGSGVRLSASQKNSRLVGRLGLGPCLVADRADVVLTHTLQLLSASRLHWFISHHCYDLTVQFPRSHFSFPCTSRQWHAHPVTRLLYQNSRGWTEFNQHFVDRAMWHWSIRLHGCISWRGSQFVSTNCKWRWLSMLLPVDDIRGLPTPRHSLYGELGLSSAPETLQFRPQPFGTVNQQLWDRLPARFRHLCRNWKLSIPARQCSASKDHLFCALQMHSSALLLLLGTKLAFRAAVFYVNMNCSVYLVENGRYASCNWRG